MNIKKYHDILFTSSLNKIHNPKKVYRKGAKCNRHTVKQISFTLGILLCTTLLKNFNTNSFLVLATAANEDNTIDSDQPYFDDINPRNITTVEDESAILKCRVKNKGNRTVSWMRKRDLHILTSDTFTYTGDQRFSVLHTVGSDDWDLKIDFVQQRDSGIYECQMNTEPKINLAFFLEVTAARARILGPSEVYVKRGSTISLSCMVNVHTTTVSWFHGKSNVDFESMRGGISLETEKTDLGTSSRLMLTRATLRDSGNYTCAPYGTIAASVQVHILHNGENPAAMQSSESSISISLSTANSIGNMLLRHIVYLRLLLHVLL